MPISSTPLRLILLAAVLTVVACNLPLAASTPTPAAEPAPTPTTPPAIEAPPESSLLSAFPLADGARWTYHIAVDSGDPGNVQHEEGELIVRVAGVTFVGEAQLFEMQTDGYPLPEVVASWYYVAVGEQLFRATDADQAAALVDDPSLAALGPELVWPISEGQMWGAPDMLARGDEQYVWVVMGVTGFDLPGVGHFEPCYELRFNTNPDTTIRTVCAGLGLVRHDYRHHGSIHDEVWELTAFQPGG